MIQPIQHEQAAGTPCIPLRSSGTGVRGKPKPFPHPHREAGASPPRHAGLNGVLGRSYRQTANMGRSASYTAR